MPSVLTLLLFATLTGAALVACDTVPSQSGAASQVDVATAAYQAIASIPVPSRSARFTQLATVLDQDTTGENLSVGTLSVVDTRDGHVAVGSVLAAVFTVNHSGANTNAATVPIVTLIRAKPETQTEASGLSLVTYKPLVFNPALNLARRNLAWNLSTADRAACLAAPAPYVIPASMTQLAGRTRMPKPDPDAPLVTLYRGVPSYSPAYQDAVQGNAYPQNPSATNSADQHIGNMPESRFTSWTLAPDIATTYTMGRGRVLKISVPQSNVTLLSPGHALGEDSTEQQVLIAGCVQGAYSMPFPIGEEDSSSAGD